MDDKIQRIWVDIGHLAQYNFYRNSIIELSKEYDILVTVIKRGALYRIVSTEFGGVNNVAIFQIGKHSETKLGIYWNSNIIRIINLLLFCFRNKPCVIFSNGFQAAFVGSVFRIPSYQYGDDPEHSDRLLKEIFSKRSLYCLPGINEKSLHTLDAPKEWSYLSPKYFKSELRVLEDYGVSENSYVFIREVSTGTTNYQEQDSNLILKSNLSIPSDFKIILSLESRSRANLYPAEWILLSEKEPDIHSLLHYSALVISSGDSMAREGAALGVKSIYCGLRIMRANYAYQKEGLLYHVQSADLQNLTIELLGHIHDTHTKDKIRERLTIKWIDINNHIVDTVKFELGRKI